MFKIIILSDQHDLLIGDQHHANMQLLNEAQNEERVKGLRQALAKAEDRIAVLTDKHLLLVHEKAELAASLTQYEANSVNSRP